MYVRWQTYRSRALRPRHRAHNDERARLKAVLVESVRVNGEPRQKYIAFLGSLTIDEVGDPHPRFWYDVTTRLEGLSNRVSPKDYERITTSIAKKVGGSPMTKAELSQFQRQRDAKWQEPA
jgi:hypothetical protein